MNDFFDSRETRSADQRGAELAQRLPALVARARANAPAWANILAELPTAQLSTRAALATLPVTRKSELLELQKAQRPFGGFNAGAYGTMISRVYASPGPIYEPDGVNSDYARVARALHAAGLRKGALVFNTFSYHMTPGAWIMEAGARAIGAAVFPAGVGNTELQIAAMHDLQPSAYAGTPSFLRILLEKADELGTPITCLKNALVSGEYFAPQLRAMFEARGIHALQCYATADAGLIAYETSAREGMIIDEGIIVEIVRPGTNEVVPDGEVGEVVVTTFNEAYPLIRFGTGDLSAVLAGVSPCGRTNTRLKGWMGRADQTAKVKGMFVHPTQVNAVAKRFAEIKRARLVITNPDQRDAMTLLCECDGAPEGLSAKIEQAMRDVTKLGGSVQICAVGSLANDGKVIDDQRKIE